MLKIIDKAYPSKILGENPKMKKPTNNGEVEDGEDEDGEGLATNSC